MIQSTDRVLVDAVTINKTVNTLKLLVPITFHVVIPAVKAHGTFPRTSIVVLFWNRPSAF